MLDDQTSVTVKRRTKDLIDDVKRDDETFNDTLRRLASLDGAQDAPPSREDIDTINHRLERIERYLDSMTADTAYVDTHSEPSLDD